MNRNNVIVYMVLQIVFVSKVRSYNEKTSNWQLTGAYERVEEFVSSLEMELNKLRERFRGTHSERPIQITYPPSCLAAMINSNGIYTIKVSGMEPFPVPCDTRTAGSGWTVIQRRQDGSENFYRSWLEYRTGFGDLGGEFFIGLDKIHFMTAFESYELYIHLEDFDGETHYAKYDRFAVSNESKSYALSLLGKYSGDAGDSLRYHVGMPFSTYDNDKSTNRCALRYVGAWWYNSCQNSNLNGQYVEGGNYEVKLSGRGICWKTWRGYDYGYKLVQMMIRPRCRAVAAPG